MLNNILFICCREISSRLSISSTLTNANGQQPRVIAHCVPTIRQRRVGSKKLFFTLLLSISSLVISSNANAEDLNGLSYTLNSPTSGQAILNGLSDDGTSLRVIDIPAIVNFNDRNYSVVSIKSRAFADKNITAVTIPEGIVNIGSNAFNGNSIASLIIPRSATNIDSYAFARNVLTSVTLANNATTIHEGMFFSNDTLLSITIPESVTSIQKHAFEDSGLISLTIPNNVTSIGVEAFMNSKIVSLTLGSSVEIIDDYAFSGNMMASLTIPDSVTSIGEYAFRFISELTHLTLGEGLETIGFAAFEQSSIRGHLVIPNSVTKIHQDAFDKNNIETLLLGSGLTIIALDSFSSNNLTAITFLGNNPTSTSAFNSRAFRGNPDLDTIDACNNGTNWNDKVFAETITRDVKVEVGCDFTLDIDSLTFNLNNPNDGEATVIGRSSGNSSTSISIPSTVTRKGRVYKVTSIQSNAFANNNLISVSIPIHVYDIGNNAFSGNSLISVDFQGDYSNSFDLAFVSNATLRYINVCSGKADWSNVRLSIGSTEVPVTFVDCIFEFSYDDTSGEAKITGFSSNYLDKKLDNKTVIIPDELTQNGTTYPLTEISNLHRNSIVSVTIGKNVKIIGSYALAENELTTLTIPASVVKIEDLAFFRNKLTSVMFLGNNPGSASFASSAFDENSTLDTINACIGSEGWDDVSFENIAVTLVSCEISFDGLAYELTSEVESASKAFEYYGANVASSIQTSCSSCHGAPKTNIGALTSNDNLANYTVLSKYISDGLGDTLLSKVRGVSHTTVFATGTPAYNALSEFVNLESDPSNRVSTSAFTAVTVLGRATGSDETDIVIPDTMTWDDKTYPVTGIAPNAFHENPITSVTIGDNVLDIGDNAFMTTLLTSVTFGNSVTTIGAGAFYQYMPGGGLTSVNLPDSLIGIGDSAFCVQKLTSVTLPASVMNIGNSAFCQITSVSFLGDYSTDFSDAAFEGNPELSVEACFDSASWKDVSFSATQTNSSNSNVKVTYCDSVYVGRIAKAAETRNGTNLVFSDLTSAGIESLIEDNFATYLTAIVAADSRTLGTLAEMQALVDEVNANSGNNDSPARTRNDVNGDGKADIIWRDTYKGRNGLWTMNGLLIAESAGINTLANQLWQIVGRGDFDGDGKSDLVWKHSESGRVAIYYMDGKAIASTRDFGGTGLKRWEIKTVGDFDGDGTDDIFWRDPQGNTAMWLMGGPEIVSSNVLQVKSPGTVIVDAGDVNGDGKDDVVWRDKLTGATIVWLMDGSKVSTSYTLVTISNNWALAGLGDLNGDGIDDFIWDHQVDGRIAAYLMNEDGQIQDGSTIFDLTNPDWYVADILDLNGDGKDDLFWRDSIGRTYIYLMDGYEILKVGEIPQSGPANNIGSVWLNIR
jgi:hypothetical protein